MRDHTRQSTTHAEVGAAPASKRLKLHGDRYEEFAVKTTISAFPNDARCPLPMDRIYPTIA